VVPPFESIVQQFEGNDMSDDEVFR